MPITTGTRLGAYEIVSAIGAGGMGEVYRARDTRLDRTVAIKILPDHLADRVELRERFDREARTIAGLNHPHICTLHDVGHQNGTDYLVMEYIEGETLAQRLAKGPLPIQQVLQYAIEIADALDKAHRKGITHRDLKSGNIMLTKSGTKLLDFGLAKLAQDAAPVMQESQMPTMKEAITAQGTILGTLQYMAPEQLEGKEVDARTDIFAFGVVVYEMATGQKAFEGKSQASLMAKILETDPAPMVTLVPMTPPALDRLVKRCLAKDPDRRWQSSGDLCEELKWIAEQGQGPQGAAASSASTRGSGERFAWIVAGVAFLIAAAAITSLFLSRRTVQPARAVRFTVAPPEKQTLPELADNVQAMSISPDGSKLAFVAMDSTSRFSLWVQDLDSQTARQLPGTDDAWSPFWSPDGQYIAFSTNNTLKKISVSGDSVESIATLPNMEMGTWNRNGDILVSSGYGFGHPILRVSSGGGPPTPITSLDFSVQASHRWPRFLPDGKHFLYTTIGQTSAASGIFVGALNSKETKQILNVNSIALYSPPGFLLFVRTGTLFAQPFDADRLELTGNAISVAQNVQFSATTGTAGMAVSDNGVLIYREVPKNGQFKLAWVDRKGIEQPLAAPPHTYRNPRLSPDGRRVAVTIDEQGSQEWLFDLGRSTLTRLTFEGNYNGGMAWSPDGKKIAFGSDRSGARNLFWEMADGSGVAERLAMAQTGGQVASSWSPDGQFLAFEQSKQAAGYDISVVRLADKKVQPFQAKATPFNEIAPRFSPDGRWLAYASDESGRYEIYVQPFPGPGGKSQVSTEGGTEPVWARNGELFYRSGNKMMVVETNTRTNFSAGAPKVLFEGHFASYQTVPSFDVTPDGQRFLVSNPTGAARAEISVVLNWTDELKQKAGAGK